MHTSRAIKNLVTAAIWVCATGWLMGDTKVQMEAGLAEGDFQFLSIAAPAVNDAGADAKWSIIQGQADANAGALAVLNDGKLPSSDDSPAENFFFAAGTRGGSIVVDLAAVQPITQIVTYSRHAGTRAPQVYAVYGATGDEEGFSATSMNVDDPTRGGWKLLANVDTRSLPHSSQYACAIADDQSILGEFRYVRFSVSVTETQDPFGNTFFSEIDILKRGAEVKRVARVERQLLKFASPDERYQFTVDTTVAPDLRDWTETELKPVIQTWYSKIVEMLPSDDFKAREQVHFQFLPSDKMRGIPAWAQNGTISMNAGWFRGELKREARGAVVHEMVHVVQDYQRLGRGRRSPPGWIVEGIPDYIRWFLYEPESKGAILSKEALTRAKHDASYRTTGNFIDWVVRNHDPQGDVLRRLNAAAREGKYSSDTWRVLTGESEEELAKAWRNQ